MMKKNIKIVIITAVIVILPVIFGLIMWNKLPETMATHWDGNGEANDYSSKAFSVFGLPLFLLAIHFLCAFVCSNDPKNRYQNESVYKAILWLVPVISLFSNFMIYWSVFGKEANVMLPLCIFTGGLFIFISRIITRCKPNHTIGIRIKYTLENEDNWNKTHKLASKLWLICGILMLLCILLPQRLMVYGLIGITLLCALIPIIYSFILVKKQ